MNRYVEIAFAVTFRYFTANLRLILRIEIFMILKSMITEAFGLWANHLTVLSFFIAPTAIDSILCFFSVILLELFEFFLGH